MFGWFPGTSELLSAKSNILALSEKFLQSKSHDMNAALQDTVKMKCHQLFNIMK